MTAQPATKADLPNAIDQKAEQQKTPETPKADEAVESIDYQEAIKIIEKKTTELSNAGTQAIELTHEDPSVQEALSQNADKIKKTVSKAKYDSSEAWTRLNEEPEYRETRKVDPPEMEPVNYDQKALQQEAAEAIRVEAAIEEIEWKDRVDAFVKVYDSYLQSELQKAKNDENQGTIDGINGEITREKERKEKEGEMRTEIMPDGEFPLSKLDLESGKNASEHINEVVVIQLKSDIDPVKGKLAVYKPNMLEHDGAAAFHGIAQRELQAREMLAYQVSERIFNLDIVPTTVIRKNSLGIGSFQEFENSDVIASTNWRERASRDELIKVAFLDYVIYNGDRHSENFLVTNEGKVWAIDNGLAFIPTTEAEVSKNPYAQAQLLKAGLAGLRSKPLEQITNESKEAIIDIPEDLKAYIERLVKSDELQEVLRDLFVQSIENGGDFFDSMVERAKTVLEHGLALPRNYMVIPDKTKKQEPKVIVKEIKVDQTPEEALNPTVMRQRSPEEIKLMTDDGPNNSRAA